MIQKPYIKEKASWDSKAILTLILFSSLYASVLGAFMYALSPEGFPLIWQHYYEIISIVAGGLLGLMATESLYGDYFNDKEVAVYLSAFVAPLLFIAPLVSIHGFIGIGSIDFGIMAAAQALIGLSIVVVLERSTHLFED